VAKTALFLLLLKLVPSPDPLLANIFAGITSSRCTERRTKSLAFFTFFVPDPCYYQTYVLNTVQYLVKIPKIYGNKYN
jgi:hypothetical protein